MKRKRYSYAERKAYYMGLGASNGGKIAKIKKTVSKMSTLEKQSFYNGFDAGVMKKQKS